MKNITQRNANLVLLGLLVAWGWFLVCAWPNIASAQPAGNIFGGNQRQNGAGQFGNQGARQGNANPGGGPNADFDSLIDLIQSTVHPENWVESGGSGDIRPFVGGVWVDAQGMLRETSAKEKDQLETTTVRLSTLRTRAHVPATPTNGPRNKSSLRFVSLPRLEAEMQRRVQAGEPLDEAMLTLAGLQRVEFLFVYPESGELVMAGPAGDWRADGKGRLLSTDTNQPVVRLDDLLTLWRRSLANRKNSRQFGCSIVPRQEALARTQQFLAQSQKRVLKPGERGQWLAGLRNSLGTQRIEFFGIEPKSRVAGVLVAADYHMKLIGMGLRSGGERVPSYLSRVKVQPDGTVPPMTVLRWWFVMNYDQIESTPEGDAYHLKGQGVRVLCENELLEQNGQRVHTGKASDDNRQFAADFTEHFTELSQKFPVYGELRNVFDLSMMLAIVQQHGLVEKCNWQPGLFSQPAALRLPSGLNPQQVETVMNYRVVRRKHIIAGVSGGVQVAPAKLLKEKMKKTNSLQRPAELPEGVWWWDGVSE